MNTSFRIPNREGNATSFLMYAYFGIISSDNGKDIVTAAIDRAYRDAASHVLSFAGDDKKGTAKANARKRATAEIQKAIDKLKDGQKIYDTWHRKLLDSLIAVYKNESLKEGYKFTYGIAQKWVNMTMKYLYVIYYFCLMCGDEDADFPSNYSDMIHKYTGDFHVPIDGYILTAAEKELGVKCISTTWSRIETYDDYFAFQKAVREHQDFCQDPLLAGQYSPIDWEGPAWMEYARKQ